MAWPTTTCNTRSRLAGLQSGVDILSLTEMGSVQSGKGYPVGPIIQMVKRQKINKELTESKNTCHEEEGEWVLSSWLI